MAKLCLSVWQWASFLISALFVADETIFCKFLDESFPFGPVNKYSPFISFCFSTCFFKSKNKNSGILKILSFLPFACLIWPIFSLKSKSLIFRLIKEIAKIEINKVRKQYLKINFWSNLEFEICLENIGKKAIIKMLPLQPGDVTETFADIKLTKSKLGYNPTVDIDVGIPKFVAWYKKYYKQ